MPEADGAPGAVTAAYRYDGPAAHDRKRRHPAGDAWHPRLARLLDAGYSYLGYRFAGDGVLFRGMPAGFLEALAHDSFWHSPGASPLCRLERELDVIFCSESAPDAMAVAKPWQTDRDAAVLVFAGRRFAARWQHGAAAVLAFADVGMVFKYPCLAEPLRFADLCAVLLSTETRGRICRQPVPVRSVAHAAAVGPMLISPPAGLARCRDGWERTLQAALAERGLQAAVARICRRYPGGPAGERIHSP